MKYTKIFICILIIFALTINISSVYCMQVQEAGGVLNLFSKTGATGTSLIDDILSNGNKFFNPGGNEGTTTDKNGNIIKNVTGATISKYFIDNIKPIIETIGLLVFYVIAAILGVRYIWSGVEGKSKVKETLPTFVVGACFFFLADTIYNFATVTFKDMLQGNSFTLIQNNIWATVSMVINILAIAGIVALGLKYMLNSADTRAEIKKDLVPVFIGLIFVFATTNILNFIAKVGTDILQ